MADLERGQRIRQLRGRLTQEAMADEVGVTLRGYQEWEAGGGIKWENVKRLAQFHDVEPDFVMNGPRGETPDLLGIDGQGRVDTLEERLEKLTGIVEQLAATAAELAAAAAPREKQSTRRSTSRKSSAKPKKRAGG